MITTMQTGTAPVQESAKSHTGLRLYSKTSGKNEGRKDRDKTTTAHSPPDACNYTTYLTVILSSGDLHCLVLYTVDLFHSCLKQTVLSTVPLYLLCCLRRLEGRRGYMELN